MRAFIPALAFSCTAALAAGENKPLIAKRSKTV
jgi:hypothetical protein